MRDINFFTHKIRSITKKLFFMGRFQEQIHQYKVVAMYIHLLFQYCITKLVFKQKGPSLVVKAL